MQPAPGAPLVLASYRVPLGCPTEQDFVQEVERRSATLRLLPDSAAGSGSERVRLRVQADGSSPGWVGVLSIEGEHALEREVRGERCQDVTLALALITVLRLEGVAGAASGASAASAAEPTAGGSGASEALAAVVIRDLAVSNTRPDRPTPSEASPAAAAPSDVSEAAVPASALEPSEREPPSPTEPSPTEPSPTEPSPTEPSVQAEVSTAEASLGAPPAASGVASADALLPELELAPERAEQSPEESAAIRDRPGESAPGESSRTSGARPGLAAHAGYAAAPSHALQVSVQAELQLGPSLHDWAGSLALTYARSAQANAEAELGFGLYLAELAACAPGLEWAGLWLRGCGEFGAGVLSISVSALDSSLETVARSRPWVALGPSLQAGLPLAEHWSLRALVSSSVLLVRDRLQVERRVGGEPGQPDQVNRNTLYRPPVATFELLLGAGYAF